MLDFARGTIYHHKATLVAMLGGVLGYQLVGEIKFELR